MATLLSSMRSVRDALGEFCEIHGLELNSPAAIAAARACLSFGSDQDLTKNQLLALVNNWYSTSGEMLGAHAVETPPEHISAAA